MKLSFPHLGLLLIPFTMYFGGIGLNELVLCVNHGAFPVAIPFYSNGISPGDAIDMVHRAMQSSDHLKFLADWIHIPGVGIASPGDMFEFLGQWLQPYIIGFWAALTYRDFKKPTS